MKKKAGMNGLGLCMSLTVAAEIIRARGSLKQSSGSLTSFHSQGDVLVSESNLLMATHSLDSYCM